MPRPSRNSQDTWACDDLMALFPSRSDFPLDSLGSDAVVSTASSSTLPSIPSRPALLTATSVSSTPFRFPSLLVPPSSISLTAPASLPPTNNLRCGVVVNGVSAASNVIVCSTTFHQTMFTACGITIAAVYLFRSAFQLAVVLASNSQLFWLATDPRQSSSIAPSGTNNLFPSRPYPFSQPPGLIAFPGSCPPATTPYRLL